MGWGQLCDQPAQKKTSPKRAGPVVSARSLARWKLDPRPNSIKNFPASGRKLFWYRETERASARERETPAESLRSKYRGVDDATATCCESLGFLVFVFCDRSLISYNWEKLIAFFFAYSGNLVLFFCHYFAVSFHIEFETIYREKSSLSYIMLREYLLMSMLKFTTQLCFYWWRCFHKIFHGDFGSYNAVVLEHY